MRVDEPELVLEERHLALQRNRLRLELGQVLLDGRAGASLDGLQLPLQLADLRPDLLADAVLLGARRLELREDGPPLLVQLQEPVDVDLRVLVAGPLAEAVRVLTELADVDHGAGMVLPPRPQPPGAR